jgi:hypothetical protein
MVMSKDKNVGKLNKLTPIAEERQLVGQAVQAGQDRTALYQDAAEKMKREFDLASQAVGQQTPRMLAAAGAFNTTGGGRLDAARAIAPAIGEAQAKLGMTGVDAITNLGVKGFDSGIDSAEYGLSAMPHVRQSTKVLGYVQLHKDLTDRHGESEANRMIGELLKAEIDQKVVQDTENTLGIGEGNSSGGSSFWDLVTFGQADKFK